MSWNSEGKLRETLKPASGDQHVLVVDTALPPSHLYAFINVSIAVLKMTFNNLTLYTTSAVLILDTDGNRVIAKYYQPPHAANFLSTATPAQQNAVASTTPQLSAKNPLATLKDQRAFEKAIFDKTKRATGDIILYDSHLVLFKASLDVIFYVVGPAAENELMLSGLLSAFYDATSMLVRHQVEKRAILENLDLVTLALDETVDDGIILETDSTTIASRVSRPRPDVNELQINEQSKLHGLEPAYGRALPFAVRHLSQHISCSFPVADASMSLLYIRLLPLCSTRQPS